MNNSLQKRIIFTIAYYNALDLPLTTFELWQNLFLVERSIIERTPFLSVIKEVDELKEQSKISEKKGFLFLKGRETLVENRLYNQKTSLRKLKHIKRWAKIFRFIPYVRSVFLTGTIAMKNTDKESDWDVTIILSKNRIWIGRFFTTVVLLALGKKRYGIKIKDRFCLNHFVTEQGIILEERNEFSANMVAFSYLLFGKNFFKKFLQLNEIWVKNNFKPGYQKARLINTEGEERRGKIQKYAELFLEKTRLAHFLNQKMKTWMVEKIKKNPLTSKKGADIRYSDAELVFLPEPQREKILKEAYLAINGN